MRYWKVIYDNPSDKMRQIFFFSIEECPNKIYLAIEIERLKKKYNLIDKYITITNEDF